MKYYTTGKASYLALLVEQFNQPIYHFLLTLSDKATAEDVLQTTWEKVMKSRGGAERDIAVKSWLFTIARNTLIDELRRQSRWQFEQEQEQEQEQEVEHFSPEKLLLAKDKLARFNTALEQLSYTQREAYIFQQEGFSVTEISQLTSESFETIKSRLRYARNNLVKLMSQS